MKKGFTIVELLVVIAILGVLLGIVSTAITGVVRNGRSKRADAMCSALQQAINTYYTMRGEWPSAIENKAKNMGDETTYTFSPDETDGIFREIVRASVGSGAAAPLIDAHALFVADGTRLKNGGEGCYENHADKSCDSYCGGKGCIAGTDFSTATNKKGKHRIPFSNMAFGYQGPEHGKFCRFWVTYNGRADSVTVSRRNPSKEYPDN